MQFVRRLPAAGGAAARWPWWVLAALALGLSGRVARAQPATPWRVYRAADGLRASLTTAVTVSPRGHVWVRHGELDDLSRLDGYTVRQIPAPKEQNVRVYESRAGRVWAVCDEGLLEYINDRWEKHPIAAFRQGPGTSSLRLGRQVPILPAEEDRVLLLLPDRLLEYRALHTEVKLLRLASRTRLGPFNDLAPAADGGFWVSGSNGVARIRGPLRQVDATTPWAEYILPKNFPVRNLQRPNEDDAGGITTVADSLLSGRRVLVHFDGKHQWLTRTLPEGNLRLAWRDLEPGVFWGLTANALVRWGPGPGDPVKETPVNGQYFDAAVRPGGVFWVATTEGLARYAPLVWRTPLAMIGRSARVGALLEAPSGHLWLATPTDLLHLWEGRLESHPWPEGFAPVFGPGDGLFPLPGGRLALSTTQQMLVFDPITGGFVALVHPAHRRPVRVLDRLPEGVLCLLTASTFATGEVNHFELLDEHGFRPYAEAPPPLELGQELWFLRQAHNGDWWLGGSSGLARWRDDKWQRLTAAEGYPDDSARWWLELDDGRIWCAGTSRVCEFDGKAWRVLQSGLDQVSALIKAGDGSVWVGTADGLLRYYQETWTRIGEEEGLPSSQIMALLQDHNRQLWVGTARGLSRYFPEADVDPPRTIWLRTEPVEDLPAGSAVQVVFQGIDQWKYTPAERLVYSSRLDEGNWAGFNRETTVVYRNLPAGRHRFEVRAMDRNWNVEPRPASLEFLVVLPWYRETRLIGVSVAGLLAVGFFAGLAVNRHIQLRRSYARVERMVADRTRELELAMQELVHSQKMTALGTLAAGIAHDFNNILSIIRGSAQVIEANLEDREKVRTRLSRIKSTVDQGAGIVKAMLGFGRARDQKTTACDLTHVVEETVRLLGERFLREVTLRVELAAGLPPVRGAQDLMQQTLLNLVLNAADALADGGEIHVRTGWLAEMPVRGVLAPAPAREYLFLAVQDNGCGIAPAILPRIFEPFFTTKAFSSRRGTGLGLYTVYEFAKEMGHGLRVESLPGKGSTFTIILPVARPGETG